ncbi:MAG TPA: tetratricopeptide repeat protein [Xanthobacteraceae bacterium]|nr:tetratricopeptide repeat protein [Xanthobacteraceae bacterium]
MPEEWISYAALKRLGADELRRRIDESPAEAARWVEAAALNGLWNAQIAWGQMQIDGHGVARNPPAGLRWFEIAARAGNADGTNMVGRCFELGWGVAVDKVEAARHYRAAAERGHAWAQFNLATLLLNGEGVPADRAQALHWYVRSARRGNAKAMTMIGRYLEHGWGRPARLRSARRWYRRGAEGGDFRGQFDHGRHLAEAGHTQQAVVWLGCAVEGGVPLFCRQVAQGLRNHDLPAMQALARRALERACATGEAADARAFAVALTEGLGGPPDPEAARRWFARARTIEAAPADAAAPAPAGRAPQRRPGRIARCAAVLRRTLFALPYGR